jgi:hypothetical protein
MPQNFRQRVVAKAAAYNITAAVDAPGTTFTNRGAVGSVTLTLPTPRRSYVGWWYDVLVVVDQTVTLAGKTAGNILTLNDLAANSVDVSTGSQKIGARVRATCVESAAGTFKWAVTGEAVGHTYTIVT